MHNIGESKANILLVSYDVMHATTWRLWWLMGFNEITTILRLFSGHY